MKEIEGEKLLIFGVNCAYGKVPHIRARVFHMSMHIVSIRCMGWTTMASAPIIWL